MQEENWKRRLPQSWRKESCKKEGVINNVKWHGDEIKKQDIFRSLMAFAEAGSVRWWKQQWVEGHFKQKDRDREHELLFPKPGSEGGEQDVLEICQRKLVVLAYSVLMMALMIKNTAPVLNELTDQQGREFLQFITQKTTPEPDDIRGFKGLM